MSVFKGENKVAVKLQLYTDTSTKNNFLNTKMILTWMNFDISTSVK
jgi:hypothetical protein